ncbi:dTMP kinase [Lacrimispora sp. 210928-DFI.3.58]|uniref:dTMP kinase n=1 Tax=Lacrimispora sp. 210928-DFI.3.58 TaxID=2883214 RepID=UPI001D097251|nr:hypothetical protein [Lacrimispora sp. 210928-DFI.3.58]MCB7320088.1 hypothetical protein [Lacrimispora sp. 210928-DFI.3.58]
MISFSGIDCSGKSTQIELLCKELERKGKNYKVVWSRGGYTPGIEFVKKIIRGGRETSKEKHLAHSAKVNENPMKRKILFLGSLMDLWLFYSIGLRLMGIGRTIICDRYIWDTYIDFKMKYPEYDFEKGVWWKLTLKTMVKPRPALCLFIPAEESMYRSTLKEEPFPEKIEVRQERINWYMKELKNNRWDYVIDATSSIDTVFSVIKERMGWET